jgi:hypothetical protein
MTREATRMRVDFSGDQIALVAAKQAKYIRYYNMIGSSLGTNGINSTVVYSFPEISKKFAARFK